MIDIEKGKKRRMGWNEWRVKEGKNCEILNTVIRVIFQRRWHLCKTWRRWESCHLRFLWVLVLCALATFILCFFLWSDFLIYLLIFEDSFGFNSEGLKVFYIFSVYGLIVRINFRVTKQKIIISIGNSQMLASYLFSEG